MLVPQARYDAVRRSHEERLLRALREQGPLRRSEIARTLGLSRSSTSEIAGGLLRQGAVIVLGTDAEGRAGSGRPAERLALDPSSGQFLGVDFGHRTVHVAVADASHEIVAAGAAAYPRATAEWPERVQTAFTLLDRLHDESGVHYRALQGVGVGVPGPYSSALAPRPTRRSGRPFGDTAEGVAEAFSSRFETPVVLDNNTRLAALGEAVRAGAEVRNLLYVRVADGVGGGLVVDGRLVTGSTGLAGELGHVRAVPAGGKACRCGKRGCVETLASTPAVLARCRQEGVNARTLADLRTHVERAHPVVDRVLREAGQTIGAAVSAVAVAVDPDEIVIGGEIARVAPVLVEQVAATVRYDRFPHATSEPRVRAGWLSDESGALGALAALFHSSPLIADYPVAAYDDRPAQPRSSAS
ncbi:ROK family transcriptional regulator [Motilibacter deserti]|uniref:ROK family protein n=1 Tax=Motilibacter deserti TaxID=2714956 RepID=A0ABX0GR16_9ACTN|nr:ROK family transcriptional regulator [Motilibacter deserti]NHC13302.1 ROK family protein [Motilibacter deserti]